MKYIIASTAVTDEIHFVDGKRTEIVAGGAGVMHYAVLNSGVMM